MKFVVMLGAGFKGVSAPRICFFWELLLLLFFCKIVLSSYFIILFIPAVDWAQCGEFPGMLQRPSLMASGSDCLSSQSMSTMPLDNPRRQEAWRVPPLGESTQFAPVFLLSAAICVIVRDRSRFPAYHLVGRSEFELHGSERGEEFHLLFCLRLLLSCTRSPIQAFVLWGSHRIAISIIRRTLIASQESCCFHRDD